MPSRAKKQLSGLRLSPLRPCAPRLPAHWQCRHDTTTQCRIGSRASAASDHHVCSAPLLSHQARTPLAANQHRHHQLFVCALAQQASTALLTRHFPVARAPNASLRCAPRQHGGSFWAPDVLLNRINDRVHDCRLFYTAAPRLCVCAPRPCRRCRPAGSYPATAAARTARTAAATLQLAAACVVVRQAARQVLPPPGLRQWFAAIASASRRRSEDAAAVPPAPATANAGGFAAG